MWLSGSKIRHLVSDPQETTDQYFIEAICPHVEALDFTYVLKVCRELLTAPCFTHIKSIFFLSQTNKVDSKTSLDDLIAFALNNLQHWNHRVRFAATFMLKSLTVGLIQRDLDLLVKRTESPEQHQKGDEEPEDSWHLLQRFKQVLDRYEDLLRDFVVDFNYKATEVDSNASKSVEPSSQARENRSRCLSFLLLWDCIIGICAKAPSELRSIYALWISRHKYEHVRLPGTIIRTELKFNFLLFSFRRL